MNTCKQALTLVLATAVGFAPIAASAAPIRNVAFASYTMPILGAVNQPSNAVLLESVPMPTPSVLTFFSLAPNNAPNAQTTPVNGSQCSSAAGAFSAVPNVLDLNGMPVNITGSQVIAPTTVYHAGEPVFMSLNDGNRNLDPAVRERIDVNITTTTGDSERVRFMETGPNTAIFTAVLQSVGMPPMPTPFDCLLSVTVNSQINAAYVDALYPIDTSASQALVDPFGTVFNSRTGEPINGATVTLINVLTGQPAMVFGDDGVSAYPSTVISGQTVTDASGRVYTFPAGDYRFPFIPPGTYQLVISAPGGFTIPSTLSVPDLANVRGADGLPYQLVDGSFGRPFVILPGSPALNIDIPADASQNILVLQKVASKPEASAGDFVQYRVTLRNASTVVASNVVISDTLPVGFRYQVGSVRRDENPFAEPVVSSDGRNLSFTVPALAPSTSTVISYVTSLTAGVNPGNAINSAIARGNAGVVSNPAQASVLVKQPFFGDCGIVIGRVVEGECATPWDQLKGVPNARILLNNGTYTSTDRDGQYHIERVCNGTHVVQLDLDSLGADYEAIPCIQNTRFAGRSFSQFVEMKNGGSLQRADFYVRKKAPSVGEVGIRIQGQVRPQISSAAPVASRQALTLNFDTRKALVTPAIGQQLNGVASQLQGLNVERLELIGHTDNVRIAPENRHEFADNFVLSRARATAVGRYLAEQLNLPVHRLSTDGRADTEPRASNSSPEGRAQNRRVELVAYGRASGGAVSAPDQFEYQVDVDGAKTPIQGLKVSVMIPDGVRYRAGTAQLDGRSVVDPKVTEGLLEFALGDVGANFKHVISFKADGELRAPAAVPSTEQITLGANFDTRKAAITPAMAAQIDGVLARLAGRKVSNIRVSGHTDTVRIAPEHRNEFADNIALSQARAQAVGNYVAQRLGLSSDRVQATGYGETQPIADNATPEGKAQNRRVELLVDGTSAPVMSAASTCSGPYVARALANFATSVQKDNRTPTVQAALDCGAVAANIDEALKYSARFDSGAVGQLGAASGQTAPVMIPVTPVRAESSRAVAPALGAPANTKTTSSTVMPPKPRPVVADDASAAGATTDWASIARPSPAFLFPKAGHNPRTAAVRVVVQHPNGSKVVLLINGVEVSPLALDGTQVSSDRTAAVSVWRGVRLNDGQNMLKADIYDANGRKLQTVEQTVNYANTPANAELVLAESHLFADGVNKPTVAVRVMDREGNPVRKGVTGIFQVNAPYTPQQKIDLEQSRQLSGNDSYQPTYTVATDDGVAYIELQATTESGAVVMDFPFQNDRSQRKQELRTWLQGVERDWVMVGFVEGSVGYNTLKGNQQGLNDAGLKSDVYTDGKASFYAKGQVKGQWLLTVAYDTDRNGAGLDRRSSLLGTIDPNEYYTLYGDGTQQRYDAPSQSRLYLKVERQQFYALFGDFETGLNQTQLSRYSRSVNGIKTEFASKNVAVSAFATEAAQRYARDEIQGNGTSGLYRLSNKKIVLNSDKIRIEVRDRVRSEQIINTISLARHVDYDVDYSGGTLFFRSPVLSRDAQFNPQFIVAEYEVQGGSSKNDISAGGRVALQSNNGAVTVGVSAIRDEAEGQATNLQGLDAKLKLGTKTEVRVEAARSEGLGESANAYLAEVEHHSNGYDALVYARKQEAGFGLNQQNAAESGQTKYGAQARAYIGENGSASVDVSRQENSSNASRDLGRLQMEYRTRNTTANVGVQAAHDTNAQGKSFDSRQATLGITQRITEKLDVQVSTEQSLGGKAESVDFPNRTTIQAGYQVTPAAKIIVAQEITDGETLDSQTTRVGAQVKPWNGASLTGSLNQNIGEYGPRTFGVLGLNQAIVVNENWGFDLSLDNSSTFREKNTGAPVINPNQPITSGGFLGSVANGSTVSGSSLTEDFTAVSAGASYRKELWSANARIEVRDGEREDRNGLIIGMLRQADAGVAFSGNANIFTTRTNRGAEGVYAKLDVSVAYRPLGTQLSVLNRTSLRYESLEGGSGIADSGLFDNNSLTTTGNAKSRALINNLSMSHVTKQWSHSDRKGNLFALNQRANWTLFYGSKYVFDRYNNEDFAGYTDLLGLEARFDLTPRVDIGMQASVLHNWAADNYQYSFGPMVGVSPVDNAWVTLGYNVVGFEDADFDGAQYSAQGPYLKLRYKFDQTTRWFGDTPDGQHSQAVKPAGYMPIGTSLNLGQ